MSRQGAGRAGGVIGHTRSYTQGNGPWVAYSKDQAAGQVIFFSTDGREQTENPEMPACDGSVYTDRLLQWSFDTPEATNLFNERQQRHFGDTGQDWSGRSAEAVSAFLSETLGYPVTLKEVWQYNHAASGYPIWLLFWDGVEHTYPAFTPALLERTEGPGGESRLRFGAKGQGLSVQVGEKGALKFRSQVERAVRGRTPALVHLTGTAVLGGEVQPDAPAGVQVQVRRDGLFRVTLNVTRPDEKVQTVPVFAASAQDLGRVLGAVDRFLTVLST